MNLRDRVKELANSSGLSLPNLEKELGFGNGTIVRWNKSTPTADKLKIVADYFGVTLDYLIGRTEYKSGWEEFKKTSEYKELLNASSGLDGLITILSDIYGHATMESSKQQNGETFYLAVGSDDEKFLISEAAFDNLYEMLKTMIPYYMNVVKSVDSAEFHDCSKNFQNNISDNITNKKNKIISLEVNKKEDPYTVIAAHNDNEDPDQYELMMEDAADLLDDDD